MLSQKFVAGDYAVALSRDLFRETWITGQPDGIVHIEEPFAAGPLLEREFSRDEFSLKPGNVTRSRGEQSGNPSRGLASVQQESNWRRDVRRVFSDPERVLGNLDSEIGQRRDKLPDPEPAGGNIPSRCEGRDFDHYPGKAMIAAASFIDRSGDLASMDLAPFDSILIDRLSLYHVRSGNEFDEFR